MMTGLELILSTVCNITSCGPNHVLPPPPPIVPEEFPSVKTKRVLEIKALRAMVNGKHFIVGTFNDNARSRTTVNNDGKITGHGIAFNILNELSSNLNFTYDIVTPPSYYERLDKNLSESWLMEKLIDHQIDIAAAFISFTMDRKNLITFAAEMDTMNCLKMSKKIFKPSKLLSHGSYMHTLQPFYANVWFIFLLTLTLYIVSLVFLTRLRSKLINDDEESFTLSSSLSFGFRTLTMQDVRQSPKSCMTRILLTTWSIFVILVSTYYGAHLSRGYILTAVHQKDSLKQEFSWLMETSEAPMAFTDISSCYAKFNPDQFLMRPSGFAYPLESNLSVLFNMELRKMYHYGFLQQHYDKSLSFANMFCPEIQSSALNQLKLVDLAAIFYCLVAGMIVAIAVFIAELLLKRLTKTNETLANQTRSEELDNMVVRHDVTPTCCRFETFPHQPSPSFQRKIVNGRQYVVARTQVGDTRLVPVDTLSALLYDLRSYEKA